MNHEVKLTRFIVKNLFGRLSYDIDFSIQERVSIIIAPNGCGKTTIFKLINFIFNPDYQGYMFVQGVPFDFCECRLSSGLSVGLKRIGKKNTIHGNHNRASFVWSIGKPGAKVMEHSLTEKMIYQNQMGREMYDDQDWRYFDRPMPEREFHIRRYGMEIEQRFREKSADIRSFLEGNGCDVQVSFISADRLHAIKCYLKNLPPRWLGYEREIYRPRNPLDMIQLKIRELYSGIQEKYNSKQQEMKDRLPKMYLKSAKIKQDYESFKARWTTYVNNIEKFCEIGLLPSNQTILEMGSLEKAYEQKYAFLEVYLMAFEQTLPPLEEHYERMKLFVDILNRRNAVTEKVLCYGDTGLVMMMSGEPIRLDCLSSGEKNDLIMFYNLVFGSEDGGLVLVDEPEISLHIEWQEEYLDCLVKICELNRLQSIVATHSPNIINGHFELYANVDMKK